MPSTVIAAMHHDPLTNDLHITYVSGLVYVYRDVPAQVYEQMKRAKSKGRFLNLHIKGKYPYEKDRTE